MLLFQAKTLKLNWVVSINLLSKCLFFRYLKKITCKTSTFAKLRAIFFVLRSITTWQGDSLIRFRLRKSRFPLIFQFQVLLTVEI